MVREQLGLSLKELPERKLMALWLALDADNSGLISAGELGAFLRGGTGAVAEAPGGEETPIKPKLYFRPQSARAKRKEKAARARTGMTSSVSLPELSPSPPKLGALEHESRVRVGGRGGGHGREAARACGGLDWRASEPSGKGAAVLNGLYEARQRFKWERNRTDFPGNERKTIFQVDDQTRYKYDTLMGRIPID